MQLLENLNYLCAPYQHKKIKSKNPMARIKKDLMDFFHQTIKPNLNKTTNRNVEVEGSEAKGSKESVGLTVKTRRKTSPLVWQINTQETQDDKPNVLKRPKARSINDAHDVC